MPKLLLNLLFISVLSSSFSSSFSCASSSWVKPIENLSAKQKLDFWTGFSLFRAPWVAAPASTKGRDGLGPLFNARSCDACHHNGAHGKLPGEGFGLVIRLGLKDQAAALENYGEQLQTLSIDSISGGKIVAAEAEINFYWQPITLSFGDQSFKLKVPQLHTPQLHYGKWPKNSVVSLRLAPALFGIGDIEQISTADILALEDVNDADNNGISGKANRVLNRENGTFEVGRFGYKAEQPNLRQQVAGALIQDIGITSWLYPEQNCSAIQKACLEAETGNSTVEKAEITREKLELLTQFNKYLRVAKSQEKRQEKRQAKPAQEGKHLFNAMGCQQCHSAFKQVNVYSDLLLHDLGEHLADQRPVYLATGQEWRTTPLRGISRKLKRKPVHLLHDGRASSVEEAILWHGGEAAQTRDNYLKLPTEKRRQLIQFIRTI